MLSQNLIRSINRYEILLIVISNALSFLLRWRKLTTEPATEVIQREEGWDLSRTYDPTKQPKPSSPQGHGDILENIISLSSVEHQELAKQTQWRKKIIFARGHQASTVIQTPIKFQSYPHLTGQWKTPQQKIPNRMMEHTLTKTIFQVNATKHPCRLSIGS